MRRFQAVEVEVVDVSAVGGGVVVDDGKRGRIDRVDYAEFVAYGFDERGFAGAHFAVEGYECMVADGFDELARHVVNAVKVCEC